MSDQAKTESSRSAELYRRAVKILPGGVSRNTVLRKPHPAYADHGHGARVVDIEGVERIDFANNMASLIHGHADPDIIAAVTEQMHKGTAFTLATEIEIEFAEHLCSRSESLEQLRFVNSGTEAVMGMLKAARAFTGRSKIAKVEGAYHGLYDFAEVSQTSNPTNWGDFDSPTSVAVAHGTPASVLESVVVIPFNDPERAIARLNKNKDEIACVIVDPMPHRVGLVPADSEFVHVLRDWTQDNGALFVFDEVITFRTEVGGFQERYHVSPDLTALGKIIGGGFPVGAIAGRSDVMDVMNPLSPNKRFPHSGTFSANPVTMAAGLTAMRKFDRDAVARLNHLALRAVEGIREALRATGVQGCVTGSGSCFRLHFKSEPPKNRRAAYRTTEEDKFLAVMLDHLFDSGFLMINTGAAALSTAMGEEEIDALVAAMAIGFEKLKAL
ncbi:MAG: aspartate aminotransferase family protein [Acidobacteriota bacterium]|nr:aspartate aminotransferase family protein [Acidobacteriota bacterium]MDH3785126.1 aspartate aminotransferase family protein [Acidobacteriota bacterium]